MKMFLWNAKDCKVEINEHEFFLIKEFADLISPDRIKSDKTLPFRELTFIYLMYDWQSPYCNFSEIDRYDSALESSKLSPEELKDSLFLTAKNKYESIQNSSITYQMILSSRELLNKTRVFCETIDYSQLDKNGRPIYEPKKSLEVIAGLDKTIDGLNRLEDRHKKELEISNAKNRGTLELGFKDVNN